jgi:hypothetical protein
MLPAAARLSRPGWSRMQQAWTQARHGSSHVVGVPGSRGHQTASHTQKLQTSVAWLSFFYNPEPIQGCRLVSFLA